MKNHREITEEAFYLNGAEAYRLRMAPGDVNYLTQANVNAPENQYNVINFPTTNVFSDDNQLAVEVHQYGTSSSDIVFGMALIARITSVSPAILRQPDNQTVAPGGAALFATTAAGTGPLAYQWRFNSTNITGATNSTLALANVQTTNGGNYSVVVSNSVGTITSQVAMLIIRVPPNFVAGSLQYVPGVSFGFLISGAVGNTFQIEASTNLATWTLLTNLTLTNTPLRVLDLDTNYPRRFYRLLLAP